MAEIEFKEGAPRRAPRHPRRQQSYSLGRHPDRDLPLDDAMASSHHAELRQENGGWQIVDLGSSNGTQLNNARISARALDRRRSRADRRNHFRLLCG